MTYIFVHIITSVLAWFLFQEASVKVRGLSNRSQLGIDDKVFHAILSIGGPISLTSSIIVCLIS